MQTHTQFTMECLNNEYAALKLATGSSKATVTTYPQPCSISSPEAVRILKELTSSVHLRLMALEGGCGTALQI